MPLRLVAVSVVFLLAEATISCRRSEPPQRAVEPATPPPAVLQRPNILAYMVDTLRADEIGCYGAAVTKTPAFDRFAREGQLFEHASTPTPATRPAIASLLTGTPPYVHGVESYKTYLSERTDSLARLPALLQSQGYYTVAIVANPNVASVFGFEKGYDEYHELYKQRTNKRTPTALDLIADANEVVRRAKAVLESLPADKPHFVFILAIDPHAPYTPPPPYQTMYDPEADGQTHGSLRAVLAFDRRLRASPNDPPSPRFIHALYRGEVSYSDAKFGELIEWMRRTGRLDAAMVVLTADHGEEFIEHGVRGHGQSVYEAVTHIPLIVRYPRQFEAGLRRDEYVDLLDLSATLLAVAGGRRPSYWFGRYLRGAVSARPVFTTNRTPKLDQVAIRFSRRKLIEDRTKHTIEVYSLVDDPGEKTPLTGDLRAQLEESLSSRLVEFQSATAALKARLIGRGAKLDRAALPDDVLRALRALGYVE